MREISRAQKMDSLDARIFHKIIKTDVLRACSAVLAVHMEICHNSIGNIHAKKKEYFYKNVPDYSKKTSSLLIVTSPSGLIRTAFWPCFSSSPIAVLNSTFFVSTLIGLPFT